MSKRLRNREVCADCSASEPRWASVNRGVLICDECCSIHRGLGRHSSQVRHLTHTPWPPSQLQMVQTLYSNGANSIWEHSLLDPSSALKRKGTPQDRAHPNKTEFIKAKYQMLAFVHRMPCREDDNVTTKDLSKQLHSSVRTGNLETCLRLLSLGAQANFFHPEKGNTPLHIAARAGQVSQAELLAVYGADPGALDSGGRSPSDYARLAGHKELADRLLEIQYELTDRLTFYLCGRRPDHRNEQHFIIPQMADRNNSLDLSEFAKAAKKKLQSLTNRQFEELAMDVYDEVDRRETDAVWLVTQNHSTLVTDTTVVPFLPVNPEYSSTRNQGRQKLARFNAHEFATLVIDILTDAKRRQHGNSCESPKDDIQLILRGTVSSRHGSEDNDQPDYDSVASDEEADRDPASGNGGRAKSSESSDLSDGPITVQEFLEVKSALSASEAKVQQLLKVNCHLSEELRLMQSKLSSLQTENSALRWPPPGVAPPPQPPSARPPARGGRPMSMYETGSGRQYPHREPPPRHDDGLALQPLLPNGSALESDYDNAPRPCELDQAGSSGGGVQRGVRAGEAELGEEDEEEEEEEEAEGDSALPGTEDVICKTEQITKNIQDLLRAAQENKHESFVPCSERIHVAVREMALLFPKRPQSETVRASLRLLTSSAARLQGECQKATPPHEKAPPPSEPGSAHMLQGESQKATPPEPCSSHMQLLTQQVIQCAYDIAKAAKQLVTVTTKENSN